MTVYFILSVYTNPLNHNVLTVLHIGKRFRPLDFLYTALYKCCVIIIIIIIMSDRTWPSLKLIIADLA